MTDVPAPPSTLERWDIVRNRRKDYSNYLVGYARVVSFTAPADFQTGRWYTRWYTSGIARIRYGQQPIRWKKPENLEVVGRLDKYKLVEHGMPNTGDYVYLKYGDMGHVMETQGTRVRILWNNTRTRFNEWIEATEIKRLARLSQMTPRSAFEF